jgi:hypothetical protein
VYRSAVGLSGGVAVLGLFAVDGGFGPLFGGTLIAWLAMRIHATPGWWRSVPAGQAAFRFGAFTLFTRISCQEISRELPWRPFGAPPPRRVSP